MLRSKRLPVLFQARATEKSWDQRVGSTSTDMKRGTFLGKVKNIKDQSPPYGFFLRKCDGREIHIFHSANLLYPTF